MEIKCRSCGNTIPENFYQEELELTGKINDLTQIDVLSQEIELTDLYTGSPLYYYYEEETLKYIENGEAPSSGIRGWCAKCLSKSICSTNEPHYGDGVYFSQHPALQSTETDKEVINSHGTGIRKHRATYVCLQDDHFKQIKKTAGVIRSKEHRYLDDRVWLYNNVVYQMSLDN